MRVKLLLFGFSWWFLSLLSCSPNSTSSDNKSTLRNIDALLREHTCLACHRIDAPLVGPSYLDIASRGYTPAEIIELIEYPRPENWPDYPPMAAVSSIPKEDLETIATWIVNLRIPEGSDTQP